MSSLIHVIILAFFLSLPAFAQEELHFREPVINQNTRWSGTIYLYNDVTVNKGVTLSIDPGSTIIVRHRRDYGKAGLDKERIELIVLGQLIARGGPDNRKILFTSRSKAPRMRDWYGIILKNLREPSILEHCIVEYAYKGITCYGSSPEIRFTEARYNHLAGISAEIRARPRIRDCVLFGNAFAGLNCELASYPIVERTLISENDNGVVIFDRSEPDLGQTGGVAGGSTGENRIYNNFEVDIYNHSRSEIFARNNHWNADDAADIMSRIVDTDDNSSYGRVLIQPVYRDPNAPQRTTRANRQTGDLQQVVAARSGSDGLPVAPAIKNEAPVISSQPTGLPPLSTDDVLAEADTNTLGRETLTVYKEEVVSRKPDPVNASVNLKEPVVEALLDSGRRTYLERTRATYPEIYLKTGFEGRVFIEVIVNKAGQVESYNVLRSDGIYFTYAAEEALSKTRYAPETYQGLPVRYKLVETYKFKIDR